MFKKGSTRQSASRRRSLPGVEWKSVFLTAFSGIFRRKARVTRPAWWCPPSLDCFEANCGGLCRKGGTSYGSFAGLSEYMVVLVFTAVLSELWHFLSSRPESHKKSWKKYFTFFCRPSRRRPFSPLFIKILKSNCHISENYLFPKDDFPENFSVPSGDICSG